MCAAGRTSTAGTSDAIFRWPASCLRAGLPTCAHNGMANVDIEPDVVHGLAPVTPARALHLDVGRRLPAPADGTDTASATSTKRRVTDAQTETGFRVGRAC